MSERSRALDLGSVLEKARVQILSDVALFITRTLQTISARRKLPRRQAINIVWSHVILQIRLQESAYLHREVQGLSDEHIATLQMPEVGGLTSHLPNTPATTTYVGMIRSLCMIADGLSDEHIATLLMPEAGGLTSRIPKTHAITIFVDEDISVLLSLTLVQIRIFQFC
ncbi:hypothetical protein J6590_081894 [Homalodisca vitripennis]|nr:hypothetical protein J6590_081894 [Homalodisca vitripennis]